MNKPKHNDNLNEHWRCINIVLQLRPTNTFSLISLIIIQTCHWTRTRLPLMLRSTEMNTFRMTGTIYRDHLCRIRIIKRWYILPYGSELFGNVRSVVYLKKVLVCHKGPHRIPTPQSGRKMNAANAMLGILCFQQLGLVTNWAEILILFFTSKELN